VAIRLFKKSDFDNVLNLLNDHSEFDEFSPGILNEKIYDDPEFDADAIFISEQNGQINGFMLGVERNIHGEKIGYIKLMVVKKAHRRQGIAREMYKKLEAYFQKKGAEKMRIYDVPFNYFMPGIDPRYTPALCFAWRMGFERFADTSNLLVDVQNKDWSTAAEEQQ